MGQLATEILPYAATHPMNKFGQPSLPAKQQGDIKQQMSQLPIKYAIIFAQPVNRLELIVEIWNTFSIN